MAGRGPAPRQSRSRRRDTAAREAEMATVLDDGDVHGPELPEDVLPDGQEWHPQTRALWSSLRRSPLLAEESPVGWQFLIDTALVHHTMWTKGRWEFASEVRLRLSKVGATLEDRMRLKVQIKSASDPAAASRSAGTVADIASRRARLTS